DEAEGGRAQLLRQRSRLRRRRVPVRSGARSATVLRPMRPHELRQRRPCRPERERRARVRDRRLDLAAVPDDPRVAEQPLDVARTELRHRLRIEARERRTEGRPLAQDREPGEPRLEALQAEPLIEATLVRHRPPPLVVVVLDVGRIGARPAAPRLAHATLTLTIPSSTRTGKVSTGSTAGRVRGRPLRMSMCAPCRGHTAYPSPA